MAKDIPKNAEWSSQVADFRKNCDCGIAELWLQTMQSNISLKVAELRLRKLFLQVSELRLRTQKKFLNKFTLQCDQISGETVPLDTQCSTMQHCDSAG